VGLNGFGRTGRSFLRAVVERDLPVDVVAVNDVASADDLAHLLARDSVHGPFSGVSADGDHLVVQGRGILVLNEREPKALPWSELAVSVAVESSGRFTSAAKASAHLDAGADRVVVSAPCKGADATFVIGVNDGAYDPDRHHIISNASCTTNCLAPMVSVLDKAFGITSGLMTTTHAYTGDQRLVDGLHADRRRARAAALNIVPTTTGAARATAPSPTWSSCSANPPSPGPSTRRSAWPRPTAWPGCSSTRPSRWSRPT
jgi:glyceraldehyde 3-phosphate dehydrogenase